MLFKNKIIFSIFTLFVSVICTYGQNASDLVVAEAYVKGDSSAVVDDYGNKNGWIELFNNSQGTVNFSGCFLSDDKNNLKKNRIPKGDLRTKLGPKQSVIFYGSGDNTLGTFYLNFHINRGSTIYLTSNDGRTIIDSLVVPSTLPDNMSVSKASNDNKDQIYVVLPTPTKPTPGIKNGVQKVESNSQRMEREDPYGVILSVVSISVVFLALILLWLLFSSLFARFEAHHKKKLMTESEPVSEEMSPEVAIAISMALDEEQGGDDNVAIAMALHDYQNEIVHDNESYVLTIVRQPSNWNNKYQNFRKSPRK